MSDRYTNRHSWERLRMLFKLAEEAAEPSGLKPRFNIAPLQEAAVARLKEGRREIALLKWGLVPNTAKDMSAAEKSVTLRAETVADKQDYRSAFRHRRCLVIADGFYAWKKISAKEKQPHYFTAKNDAPFAFAGLWDSWVPREGPRIETFAILTCKSNAVVTPVTERMPVMLPPEAWSAWLGEQLVSPDKLKTYLKPYPDKQMEGWPVAKRIDDASVDEAGLVAPTS